MAFAVTCNPSCLYGWGSNGGRLGTMDADNRLSPVAIEFPYENVANIRQITTTGMYTIIMTQSNLGTKLFVSGKFQYKNYSSLFPDKKFNIISTNFVPIEANIPSLEYMIGSPTTLLCIGTNQQLYMHGSCRFNSTDTTGLPPTHLSIAYVRTGLQFAILVSGTWQKKFEWRHKLLLSSKLCHYTDVIVNRY